MTRILIEVSNLPDLFFKVTFEMKTESASAGAIREDGRFYASKR